MLSQLDMEVSRLFLAAVGLWLSGHEDALAAPTMSEHKRSSLQTGELVLQCSGSRGGSVEPSLASLRILSGTDLLSLFKPAVEVSRMATFLT